MIDLKFASSAAALLRGAESLLVIAPQRSFSTRHFLDGLLPDALRQAVIRVAAQLEVGNLSATAETFCDTPQRLHVAVAALRDEVSRHHAPSRPECVRHAVATAPRRGRSAAILAVVDDPAHALSVANAIGRASPVLSLKSGAKPTRCQVLVVGPDGRPVKLDAVTKDTVAAAREAARLVDLPPTELDPARLASEARRALRGLPQVKIQEIRGARLLEAGLRAIHAVGRCAVSEPRVLIASHRPARPRGPHIALVGKGVTYDTGGLHLKSRGSMETMKGDMGGAAAVLGAFRVLAAAKAPQRVSMVLCLAENAIGPGAYKPDDVLTMHSGKTVEINNTDAEGRLLLGDGVSYAARTLRADVVLDAATLTGAQMVATGDNHAAVVSNDAELEALFVEAGRDVGDLVHPLPFVPEFYRPEFSSPIADMRNSVKNRSNAQTSCAAWFVFSHLDGTKTRWGHVDLAGPAMRSDRGTGYGVALLAEVVRRLR